MLTPTKHTNIKYSVAYIAGNILKYLQNENMLKYDDIKALIMDRVGKKARYNINNALVFLYAMNKIEYLSELDTIVLLKEKQHEN